MPRKSSTGLEISLKQNTPDGWERLGEFQVLESPTRIPDEFDELHIVLIRASNVGVHFGIIVSAFANNKLTTPDLPQSRTDANIIASAKVIEHTLLLKENFASCAQRALNIATQSKEPMKRLRQHRIKQQKNSRVSLFTGKPKDKVKYLLARVDNNSLSMHIRFACKKLTEDIHHSAFNHTKSNPKCTQIGNKFADIRNDIAYGNKSRQKVSGTCAEYKLKTCLVFMIKLMQLEISSQDASRYLGYKG